MTSLSEVLATLTTRVLRIKRRSEAFDALPELRMVPDLAARFDAWAAAHPRRGCAHDDVLEFLAGDTGELPEPLASLRAIPNLVVLRPADAAETFVFTPIEEPQTQMAALPATAGILPLLGLLGGVSLLLGGWLSAMRRRRH